MFGSIGIITLTAAQLGIAAQNAQGAKVPHSGQHHDPAVEAQKDRDSYASQIQELNKLNPFSNEYAGGVASASGTPAPLGTSGESKSMSGPAAQLQKLLSNRAVQSYLKLFSSPKFADGAETIAKSPNKKTLIWVEIVWFLLMFLSRSARLSKLSTSSWGQVVFVNFSHFIVMWSVALIVIPWILFGEPYRQVLAGFWQVLTQ